MRKYKNKIIAFVSVVLLLAFAFWYGGDAPGLRGWNTNNDVSSDVMRYDESETAEYSENVSVVSVKTSDSPALEAITELPENSEPEQSFEPKKTNEETLPVPDAVESVGEVEAVFLEEPVPEPIINIPEEAFTVPDSSIISEQTENFQINEDTVTDGYQTEPVSEGQPAPVEPQNTVISDKELCCTLSVRCDTILDNKAWMDLEKLEIIPKDGVIFEEKAVTFYEGESVFNILVREMKRNKIHFEFVNVPVFNSSYIEGIANIYEFDCGELSGWMYKVNGWFPNYGCSRYSLKEGDRVEVVYTCNLGEDVGGKDAAKGNMKPGV